MRKIINIFLFSITALYSQQNSMPALAISDLVSQSISTNEANVISEQLRAELYKTNRFRIIERSQMLEILKEQGFQQTGCTNDICAVKTGQLLGVNNIIVGTIGLAGSYIMLTVRIIDVKTGEVLVSESIKTKAGIDGMVEAGVPEIATMMVTEYHQEPLADQSANTPRRKDFQP